MEIGNHWKTIQSIFQRALKSSYHFAVGTLNKDGSPHITPIGGILLRDNQTGFIFEVFSTRMSHNLKRDQRVCILAMDSDAAFWTAALMTGRCHTPPSVRLMGVVGEQRECTKEEIDLWHKQVEYARDTKGHDLLWKEMRIVRDIIFDSFAPVNLGEMTKDIW